MHGVGAVPPLLIGAPAPHPGLLAPPHLPPLSSSCSLSRRRPATAAAAAAAKQKQGSRRWWSDYPSSQEEEEEEEEYDDFFPGNNSSSSFGGELFDEPWFSKVFKTYGFLLPVMLASMLVATGPRAFLMAMAIPLAQSAVSFLLDLIWGRNARRKPSPFQEEEDDDDDFPEYSSDDFVGGRDRKGSNFYRGTRRPQSYQSWTTASTDDLAADKDDYSTKNSKGGGGFGGWDELVDDAAQPTGRNSAGARTSQRTRIRTDDEDDDAAQGQGAPLSRRRARRGRMSATSKYKQAPLLMRLMVALFPFLGSWFRLL